MANIVVPQLGESVVEARVLRWIRQVGDRVAVGDALVELETDKVNLEVTAEKSGTLASIAHQEGDDVRIGLVLGTINEEGTSAASPTSVAAASPGPATAPAMGVERSPTPAERTPASQSQPPEATTAPPPRVREAASPAPAPSRPSAPPPDRRAAQATPTAAGRPEERRRMSKRRATIARRLVEAQRTAAMLTTFNEVDMSAVMALRERHKDAFKKQHGVSLGIASFFVKASVAALKAFPQLNAEIQGDEIVLKKYYDIGVAVGAEGGLVVPVLRDAETLSFAQIETAIRSYASKAAEGTLTLEDLTGGTFTITNGGVFGSLLSTPILNPPQVGILGLHKVQDRAVPVDGRVVIQPMMYVALSYDHRLVDGREAVQFLVAVKAYVEDPGQMLIGV